MRSFCKHGNEVLGTTKVAEFTDQLTNHRLHKKGTSPCNNLRLLKLAF
jgi:hypothetical protein